MKTLISTGVTKWVTNSVTISNIPNDGEMLVIAIIRQDNCYTRIEGNVPKMSAPMLIKKNFFRRLFSRDKYDRIKRGRIYEIHSPNGLSFDCHWELYETGNDKVGVKTEDLQVRFINPGQFQVPPTNQ